MSTVNFLVLASLTKIGKNSPLKPAKAADVLTGMDSLASLLQQFRTQNILIGTAPISSSTSEVGETLDSRNHIINILAVEIASNYDSGQVVVSQTLKASEVAGRAFLKKWYTKALPTMRIISSTAPRGSGNTRFLRNDRQFFGPFRILEDPEAIAENENL